MPALPFRLGRRSEPTSPQLRDVVRVHDAGAHAWRTYTGPDAHALLRARWPRHGSRVAVLLGNDLDATTVETLRVVYRTLGISAVDRADGACHAPAGAVISAALGRDLLDPTELVRAECVITIGDPGADDRALDAHLHTARATGVPVVSLGEAQPAYATTHLPVARGDVASFVQAAVRTLLAEGAIDRAFITAHTRGFGEFLADLEADAEPDLHRHDMHAATALRTLVAAVRNQRRIAVVWRPSVRASDAMIARAVIGLLLVRGAVGQTGGGLCVTGPVAQSHAAECCAVRSSGLNTGVGPMAQPLGVVERARLGDLDVLVTLGTDPFDGVDRALEREALEAVDAIVHLGTLGSDTLPALHTSVFVLPGAPAVRLGDLLAVIDPGAADVVPVAAPIPTSAPVEYAFVARAIGERRSRAS